MMENTVSLETLKVENYSMESGLTSVNRRTVDKMFHYIHSFPLDEYDVELIRKDIIGMAMEGEQRNEPLHMMIGKKPRDFCNDLIYAIAGFTVPICCRMVLPYHGRALLSLCRMEHPKPPAWMADEPRYQGCHTTGQYWPSVIFFRDIHCHRLALQKGWVYREKVLRGCRPCEPVHEMGQGHFRL